MKKTTYCCKIKIHGREETVTVLGVSSMDAQKMVLASYPGAIVLSVARGVKDQVDGTKSRPSPILVIGLAVCALLVVCIGLLAYLALRTEKSDSVDAVSVSSVEKIDSGKYSSACMNLVSVSTDDSSGSGFKVKVDGNVYLYTCLHCITSWHEIKATDSRGNRLELGELERYEGRDLVRFRLFGEKDGFELASDSDMVVGAEVIAYGDTLGGGVFTENRGKILAVGTEKIEIDAAVLQGNSGGPVLLESGKVVGVVSSGSYHFSPMSKDTRYEKVRRFAERVNGSNWDVWSYSDYRDCVAYLCDVSTMIAEFRQFTSDLASAQAEREIIRPFRNNSLYHGDFGCAECASSIYETYNRKITDTLPKVKKALEYSEKYPNDMAAYNRFNDLIKEMYRSDHRSQVGIQVDALNSALLELKAIDFVSLKQARDAIVKDIETIMLPAYAETNKEIERREKQNYEIYIKQFR